mgnify:FL=1
MTDIKIFPMGFGESVMLSNENECMLVDCGSESEYKNTYFNNVFNELDRYDKKSAMLSHFHEDHINGFIRMAKENRHRFETVYIPDVFTFSHPNFVDMEIIKYILESIHCPGERTLSLWDLLKLLCDKKINIKPLKRRKKAFCEIGEEFDVLWPVPENVVSKRFYNALKLKLTAEIINSVERISNQISELFISSEGSFTADSFWGVHFPNIDEMIDEIVITIKAKETNLLSEPEAEKLIKTIRSEANKTSIVFQNSDENICKNVLMTGDITNGIMKKIAENSLTGSVPLKKNYYCIKVPHHGTETHYFNFGCYTVFQNLLISNGETNKSKRKKISKQYNLLNREYNIVCTNCSFERCECFDVFPKITCSNANDKCNCKFYRDILIL